MDEGKEGSSPVTGNQSFFNRIDVVAMRIQFGSRWTTLFFFLLLLALIQKEKCATAAAASAKNK